MTQPAEERVAAMRRRVRAHGVGKWGFRLLLSLAVMLLLHWWKGKSLWNEWLLGMFVSMCFTELLSALLRRRTRRHASGLSAAQHADLARVLNSGELRGPFQFWPPWHQDIRDLAVTAAAAPAARPREVASSDPPTGRGHEPTATE